ncbi:MAG: fatty acid desaturase [Pirellulaceae bacterium]|nr:fatty acid desaturase [Pirellulaceae bacterium]
MSSASSRPADPCQTAVSGGGNAQRQATAGRIPRPAGAEPLRLLPGYTISIGLVHALSLLALVPWFFSWTGLVLAIVGHYFFGLLGMTLGYHRLLAHRGFTCPRWFERFLAILGVCCLQDSPARWVALHRRHHQYSDEPSDPHSPLVTFFWGHLGWLLFRNRETSTATFYDHYARDLLKDPFYLRLERHLLWLWIYIAHAALFFLAGLALGWATTGSYAGGVQLGLSLLVWGVFVRTVFVWHVTWSVNSLTHLWGYRNYETTDSSRNNWLVALLAHGEGWHNNHHAEQRSAAHGHRWSEFDLTWLAIRGLERLGLVRDVVRPKGRGE